MKSYRRDGGNGGEPGGRSKKRRHDNVGPEGADRGYLVDNKKTTREAQGAEGFHKNCREEGVPFVASDQSVFVASYHQSPLGRINASSIE